jgi:hypothetical protein
LKRRWTPRAKPFWLLPALGALCLVAGRPASAGDQGWTREQKLVAANVAVAGGILTWGAFAWDYGSSDYNIRSEGWFGENTSHGGADKTGHFYAAYVFSHGFAGAYQHWGYDRETAARYGAFSSWGATALMEVGDGFSDFGSSYEDLVMNTAGAAAGWLLYRSPSLQRKLDFRVQYWPGFDESDITTDYERLKYLAAVKLGGFDAFRDTPLRWLELHAGYFTRGYEDVSVDRERNVFVGLGINLSALLEGAGWHKSATFLRYYQPPGTSLQWTHDLND